MPQKGSVWFVSATLQRSLHPRTAGAEVEQSKSWSWQRNGATSHREGICAAGDVHKARGRGGSSLRVAPGGGPERSRLLPAPSGKARAAGAANRREGERGCGRRGAGMKAGPGTGRTAGQRGLGRRSRPAYAARTYRERRAAPGRDRSAPRLFRLAGRVGSTSESSAPPRPAAPPRTTALTGGCARPGSGERSLAPSRQSCGRCRGGPERRAAGPVPSLGTMGQSGSVAASSPPPPSAAPAPPHPAPGAPPSGISPRGAQSRRCRSPARSRRRGRGRSPRKGRPGGAAHREAARGRRHLSYLPGLGRGPGSAAAARAALCRAPGAAPPAPGPRRPAGSRRRGWRAAGAAPAAGRSRRGARRSWAAPW